MKLPRPRIVVATSGTRASRHATEVASQLASAFEAELTHVAVRSLSCAVASNAD